jgi:hypothetical protein
MVAFSSKIRTMDGCSKRTEILFALPCCERDHGARIHATGRLMCVVFEPRNGKDTLELEEQERADLCFTSRNAFLPSDCFDDLVVDAVDLDRKRTLSCKVTAILLRR